MEARQERMGPAELKAMLNVLNPKSKSEPKKHTASIPAATATTSPSSTQQTTHPAQRPASQPRAVPAAAATAAQPSSDEADAWRERGNASFKAGKLEDAYACYCSSIDARPTCTAHANRALISLKQGDHAAAEKDCTAALGLDATYVKALLRRAAARRELGRLLGAISDLEAALMLEPGNKAAAEDRRTAVAQWADIHGAVPPEPERIPVTLVKKKEEETETGAALLSLVSTKRTGEGAGAAQSNGKGPKTAVVEIAAEGSDEDEAPPPLPPVSPAAGKANAAKKDEGEEERATPQTTTAFVQQQERGPSATLQQPSPPLQPPHILPVFESLLPSLANAKLPPPQQQQPIKPARRPPTLSASTTGSASSLAPPLPPPTGVQFEKAWRGMKGNVDRQAAYLLQIDPPKLAKLLKQVLTPSLLVEIQRALLEKTAAGGDGEKAAALLQALTEAPRFMLVVMGLSSKEKAALGLLWDATQAAAPELAAVRPKYKV